MLTLTKTQWIETYIHIAQEIGERYHCIDDFDCEEWAELCNFAQEIMYSAEINMGDQ